jgi:hypothetical protein
MYKEQEELGRSRRKSWIHFKNREKASVAEQVNKM